MTRGSMRCVAGCTLIVLSLAMAAWARNGIVTLKDGTTFEGEVTENANTVTVVIKGKGPARVQRANVKNIEYLPGPKEQFDQRMAKLNKTDVKGRVELAKWAIDNQEYDLAINAADAAVAIDANNEEAMQVRKTAEAKRQAAKNGGKATGPSGAAPENGPKVNPSVPGDDGTTGARPADNMGKDLRLVTAAEINRIRQLEFQKGENVQMRLQNGVKQRYLASSDYTPEQFNKMTPLEQGFQILDNGSSKLKNDVIITSDPAAVAQFKSVVQRNVLPGCASVQCHGGNNAGAFKLRNPAVKDPEAYTNFLVMQAYTTTIDGKEYTMIDRARPENSLVLHYGLPQADSTVPHPKAQNFKPIFRGTRDPKYQQIIEWASKTLAPVAPEYKINLSEPPEGDSTTRPARNRAGEDAPAEQRPPR